MVVYVIPKFRQNLRSSAIFRVDLAWNYPYIRLVSCYFYLRIGIYLVYIYMYVRLVLCYSYLPICTWYIYAWFCAILTCLFVLSIYTPGFVLFLLVYWYLVYAWFCAILTCLLVLGIYTPGFVLFLLAYWYLVYIYVRLVLCYSYLPIGTWYIYAWFCAILTCLFVLSIYTPGFVLFLIAYWYLVYITRSELASLALSLCSLATCVEVFEWYG